MKLKPLLGAFNAIWPENGPGRDATTHTKHYSHMSRRRAKQTSYSSDDDGTDRGRFDRRTPYKSGWITASCTMKLTLISTNHDKVQSGPELTM